MIVKYIPKTVAFPIVVHLFVFCKSEDSIQNAYLSKFNLTWEESKTRCTLIGSKGLYNVENYNTEKGWINETASYSPWYDYLGCFQIKKEILSNSTTKVMSGYQFSECSQICKDYLAMGLQVSSCACFSEIKLDTSFFDRPCRNDKTDNKCVEDTNTFFCAKDNRDLLFSIYRKVKTEEDFGDGNCLSVIRSKDAKTYSYAALNCSFSAPQICSIGYHNNSPSRFISIPNNWAGSCDDPDYQTYRYLTPYTHFKKIALGTRINYWLGNTRRMVFHSDNSSNAKPKHCVAAKIDSVGRVQKTIEDCKMHFPALCFGSPLTEMTDTETDKKGLATNEMLVIAVSVTAVLTVIVLILVAVLFVRLRRNRTRHEHRPVPTTSTTTKEIVYAQVNKTKISPKPTESENESAAQSTSCDVYDLMDHRKRSISDRQQPENDYDTMKSIVVEEDDYDFANESNIDKIFVVNEDNEYSHVQT